MSKYFVVRNFDEGEKDEHGRTIVHAAGSEYLGTNVGSLLESGLIRAEDIEAEEILEELGEDSEEVAEADEVVEVVEEEEEA